MNQTLKNSFLQFSRNGYWGTCGDCPIDSNGQQYPEFCEYKDRYDHRLDIDSLVEQYKIQIMDLKK